MGRLEGREYLGSRNRKLHIFPGSSQAKKRPAWILAAEIVETSGVYARCVANVEPGWALDINPALLKYHYYEPHWQKRTGRVMALRRTSLFGLVLVDRERVHYGRLFIGSDCLITSPLPVDCEAGSRKRRAPRRDCGSVVSICCCGPWTRRWDSSFRMKSTVVNSAWR